MAVDTQQRIKLEPGWKQALLAEFDQPYMKELRLFLQQRKRASAVVFPPAEQMFNAFNATPFDQVKVVMLGQDPYHGAGQAHGLCFSVQPGVPVPPSLRNMYAELETDIDFVKPEHGHLQPWAAQGVFLLNSVLTVEQGNAGCHAGKGWERFTDAAVRALAERREGVVFMLWGAYAQKKGQFIDRSKHCVLRAPHPSPLSAYRGFFGCQHFSKANEWLESNGLGAVDWALPELGED